MTVSSINQTRPRIFTIASILLGMVAGIILLEIVVRTFFKLPDYPSYNEGTDYKDPNLFDLKKEWSGKLPIMDREYYVHTDQFRLRHTQHVSKPPYDMKILILGDSFAFGMGVNDDETMASILEKTLLDAGIQAYVVNAGVPAYQFMDMHCKYQKIKDQIDFDWVVLAASYNDVTSPFLGCKHVWGSESKILKNEYQHQITWEQKIYRFFRNNLLSRSKLAFLLAYRLNPLLIRLGIRGGWTDLMYPYHRKSYVQNPKLEYAKIILTEFKQLFLEGNKKSLFVYIPGMAESNDSLWELSKKVSKEELDRNAARNFLIQTAKSSGFNAIIDPLQDEKNKLVLKDQYFPIDMHLNEAGHRYFGELMAKNLIELAKQK